MRVVAAMGILVTAFVTAGASTRSQDVSPSLESAAAARAAQPANIKSASKSVDKASSET